MTSVAAVVAAAAAVGAAALGMAPPVRLRPSDTPRPTDGISGVTTESEPLGLIRRGRSWWAVLAGVGAAVMVGGPMAVPAGVVAAVVVWKVAGRVEPVGVRRRREEVRRDLPHVVGLFASALEAGAATGPAIGLVCRSLPGAAADRLSPIAARLELGADPGLLWGGLATDPELAPLGRTMARAHRSGAPVAVAVSRLGAELADRARGEVEDRARAVGVRAAVPLGVCLLPAFLLIGIVPLVAGLAESISW